MTVDIIVYAIIAAGLVFWLRSILGTRSGDERERPAPLIVTDTERAPDGFSPLAPESRGVNAAERIEKLAAATEGKFSIANKSAEKGLLQIVNTDETFNVNFFLDGAQEAFAIIVEAFAAGDRETLEGLLGETVYKAFDQVIAEREKRNEKQAAQIRAVRKAEIIETKLARSTAFITVRFTADEVSVTHDEHGNVIDGHPEKVTAMRDIWTFSRDLRSKDPRWLLVETRGGFEGDNDLLPNAV